MKNFQTPERIVYISAHDIWKVFSMLSYNCCYGTVEATLSAALESIILQEADLKRLRLILHLGPRAVLA